MALLNTVACTIIRRRLPAEFSFYVNSLRCYSDEPQIYRVDYCPGREQIGYGINSEKLYYDRLDFPCPSVRYKRETADIKVIM